MLAHWVVEGAQDEWVVLMHEQDVALAPHGTALPEDISAFLDTQRQIALAAIPHGGGLLSAPLEAMEATLAANTFALPHSGEILTVSRHTAEQSGEWAAAQLANLPHRAGHRLRRPGAGH